MRSLLLADDSVTIQKVVELTFMDADWEVRCVSDGDEALAEVARRRPDVVVADVHMPGASGYEVSRKVKESHPRLPVLLLVGTFEPIDESELAACRADAHLTKPFDSQELARLVEELARGTEAREPAPADEEPAAARGAEPWSDEGPFGHLAEEAGAAGTADPGPAARAGAGAGLDMRAEYAAGEAAGESVLRLSEADVDRIARRVVELISDRVVREVVWEVVPDLAEVVIKDRLRELEAQAEPFNN